MNKSQLIAAIAEKSGLTKDQSQKALEAFTETVEATLKGGDEIRLVGFGTYSVKETKERTAINPATREKMVVKASKKPVFKFGQSFADKFSK